MKIKRVSKYTFDKDGHPINKRGKRLTNKITATFKHSPNNAGSRVDWIHFEKEEVVRWKDLILQMNYIR